MTAVSYRDSRTDSIHRFPPISENQQKVTAGPTAITNWTPGGSLSRIQRLACLGITGAVRYASTNAVEAFICLPPLDLVLLSEESSDAHRLWILGCWSYLHPSRGHSSILMWPEQSDPIFNMGVEVMRPIFNPEPKYRVTMLTGEDWTKGTGAPIAVKGLVWFTEGSKMREGLGWSLWAIGRKKAQLFRRQIRNRISGRDICYLGLCLRNSIAE